MFQLCFQNLNELWRNYFKSQLYVFTLTMVGNFFIFVHYLKIMGYHILSLLPIHPNTMTAECHYRHVVEKGITLLHNANLPLKFWPYAFNTAAYLINRLPNQILDGDSPYFRLYGTLSNYNKLRDLVVYGIHGQGWI